MLHMRPQWLNLLPWRVVPPLSGAELRPRISLLSQQVGEDWMHVRLDARSVTAFLAPPSSSVGIVKLFPAIGQTPSFHAVQACSEALVLSFGKSRCGQICAKTAEL